MQVVTILYKFVYCAILATILAVLVSGMPFSFGVTRLQALLLWTYVVVLLLTGFTAVAFRSLSRTAVWGLVILFCAFFSWHSWFGPGGFFVQTEVHTFDPVGVVAESRHFKEQAALPYMVIMVWFLSMPIFRQMVGRASRNQPKREVSEDESGHADPPKPK
jgi:hypothetical protein